MILREDMARFVLTGSLILLLLAFVAFLSLLPAEIALQIEAASLEKTRANAPSSDQINNDRETLADAGSYVRTLLPFTTASSTGFEAIGSAIADRPKGIALHVISYSPGTKTITISGVALASADIAAYQSALKADAHFSSVQIPVGALVGGDKQFSVTLSGDF